MSLFHKFLLALVLCPVIGLAETAEPPLSDQEIIRGIYQQLGAEWSEIPPLAIQALIAAEDRDYFDRFLVRSNILWALTVGNFGANQTREQLRITSLIIGLELTHDEALNWYANTVYIGQNCYGLAAGATVYFGSDVSDLSVSQLATLAALPKAPALFHPERNADQLRERRNFVLREMAQEGFISQNEVEAAMETALTTISPLGRCAERI